MAKGDNGDLGFEADMWKAADKLRSNMDAAEYKHVVLGLIFLKYISDVFEEKHQELVKLKEEGKYVDPEDQDEYIMHNIFWVPTKARWTFLQARAKQPEIGKFIDEAMDLIEQNNKSLKGVLSKDYNRPSLNKQRLGELIDLIGTIALGDSESRSKDILGRVYEYFLGEFANAEGKKGGQFYTPRCIVNLLVEMIKPFEGRVFDPCCGSGGMFVSSERFIEAHGGSVDDISIYGQESNPTTWKLCKMNLAIRNIPSDNIKWNTEGSFQKDLHPDLKANFILANPPFNDSDWGGERLKDDVRWKYGIPPEGNANFAWVQHFLHHLTPNGTAGFVLANSSLSAERTGEIDIRKNIIASDLVECVVVLPKNLFYNTSIPACLWFIAKNKREKNNTRHRENEMLFIDARNYGVMVDKTHRVLTDGDISFISEIYHNWRAINGNYNDLMGICKSVSIDEVKQNDYNLSPNLYIDLEKTCIDLDEINSNIQHFISHVIDANKERIILEEQIQEAFNALGYDGLQELNYSNINLKDLIDLQQLLFNKWFINFDIPIDKYRVNSFYSTSNKDIQKLPINWKLEKLSQQCYVIDCLHSKKPLFISESEFTLLEVNNISSDGLLDMSVRYSISQDEYNKWTKNIEVCEGDCVVTNTGRVGAVAQIPKGSKFAIGRNMTAIRVKSGQMTPTFLLNYLLSSYMFVETYRKTDIGTILDSLNVKGIKKLLIVVPPFELLEQYERFARPMRRLIEIGFEVKGNSNGV